MLKRQKEEIVINIEKSDMSWMVPGIDQNKSDLTPRDRERSMTFAVRSGPLPKQRSM